MEKKALVLGLGVSGLSAKKFLESLGYSVICVDNKNDKELSLDLVKSVDLAVISPGVPKENSFYKMIREHSKSFLGEAELGLFHISEQDKDTKIYGVTGSNGKTTLCSLLEHIFQAKALGNIGTPFTEYLMDNKRYPIIIAELSSFQIETLHSKVLDVAVILNITPNHLDRYKDFEEYAQSKLYIVSCIKPSGKLILPKEIYEKYKDFIHKMQSSSDKIEVDFIEDLVEKHQVEFTPYAVGSINVAIAKELAQNIVQETVLVEKLQTFKKPPHRLEHVANVAEVEFINDSKATTIESALFAVKSILAKKHIIMGGSDKGLDFRNLLPMSEHGIVSVYAIGDCAKKIQLALQEKIPVTLYRNLEEATRAAFNIAKPGEVVLLSPACASYDSFDNFEHRGRVFKECVYNLQKEESLR